MFAGAEQEEPEWVEVMVDILLSLLSQQSRHIRQVCKAVFSSICPHVTAPALAAILEVRNTSWTLDSLISFFCASFRHMTYMRSFRELLSCYGTIHTGLRKLTCGPNVLHFCL